MDFTEKTDLADLRLGGAVIFANDEFFASKDNLVRPERPVFVEGKYTDRGKWMDGWESRRRREDGHDFCLVRLGVPGVVRGLVVDTAFFKGNYPEQCSIEVCSAAPQATPEELLSERTPWTEILPKSALKGDTANRFAVDRAVRATHLRLHIYPDGGVARLRVHGDPLPHPRWLGRPGTSNEVDLAALENGGSVIASSDMFFGSRHNLILPGRAANMGDGWETKRSRRVGFDWAIVALAAKGTVERVEIDTNHFKGNFPESAALEVCDAGGVAIEGAAWREVLPRTKLLAHTRHFYEKELAPHPPATHARLSIFPDGGVSRLRLWGQASREGREEVGMRFFDALPVSEAVGELVACCSCRAWAERVAGRRPFGSLAALAAAGEEVWRELGEPEWREAMNGHPRIGERKAGWSKEEQAGALSADPETQAALAAANREYEATFGHIYLVCATGKSAAELLEILRQRLKNEPLTELRVAAEEQRKITGLRLERMIAR